MNSILILDIFLWIFLYRGIAQLVEQWSPKPRAVSSILTAPAKPAVSNMHTAGFFRKNIYTYIHIYQI